MALVLTTGLNAQTLTVQATLSNHNGYNVSCFGGRDGAIDLAITGGQAPYSIEWSIGATSEDIADLPAGYYAVIVRDQVGTEFRGEYTLTEPENLEATASVYVYPNGRNLSCYQCFNGSISLQPAGGAPPYTNAWSDGVTTQHRYNLGAVQTHVTVTDANGCMWNSEIFTLTSPERSDWTMTGNAGSNPATHYLGTSDNKDLVFKTNGVEELRLNANGTVQVKNLGVPHGYSLLLADSLGTLKSLDDLLASATFTNQYIVPGCNRGYGFPWMSCGNEIAADHWIGSTNAKDFRIGTNNVIRMTVDKDGKVIIGPPGYLNTNTTYPYGLYVANGIITEKVKVAVANQSDWSDHVFAPGYRLMPLAEVDHYIATHGHLPDVPSAACMVEEGLDVVATDAMLLQKIEELTLHLIAMEERLGRLEVENAMLRSTLVKSK